MLGKRANSMSEVEGAQDLKDIKKLLIVQLVSCGVKQADIAKVLNVAPSTLSEMFPKGVLSSVRQSNG